MLARLVDAAAPWVLDVHRDPHHHRAVITVGGDDVPGVEAAVRDLARQAVALLDLRTHQGVHPRLGVVDVVPFVPLDHEGHPAGTEDDLSVARAARDRFAAWAAHHLGLACARYGPERTLPDLRRLARAGQLAPDWGPSHPQERTGTCAVGARSALVAYNLWLTGVTVHDARRIAARVRGPAVRSLGLAVGDDVQVSCNLIDPDRVGPADVHHAVADRARQIGCRLVRAELVGLVPARVLDRIDPQEWALLDLGPERTVEARLAARTARAPRPASAPPSAETPAGTPGTPR